MKKRVRAHAGGAGGASDAAPVSTIVRGVRRQGFHMHPFLASLLKSHYTEKGRFRMGPISEKSTMIHLRSSRLDSSDKRLRESPRWKLSPIKYQVLLNVY